MLKRSLSVLDTPVFIDPGVGVFGDAPRNVAHGPHVVNIDLSIHKGWKLTERFGLQFRGDFYNLPNHPNFAGSTGRQTQLSMRVEF